MTALLISLSILLGLLLLLLWLPLQLKVDTRRALYLAQYGPWLRARASPDPDSLLRLQLRLFHWKKEWSPMDLQKSTAGPGRETSRKPGPDRKKQIGKRTSATIRPARILGLLKSFRIREFQWELDTGHPAFNAQLFPAFYLAGQLWGTTHLNFEGRNSLVLHLENRPIRMLIAWLRS